MAEMKICVKIGPSDGKRLVKNASFTLHINSFKNIAEVSLKFVKLGSMIPLRIYTVIAIFLLAYTTLYAQTVKIGTIDVYGNRNVDTDTILQRSQISVGDSISRLIFLHGNIETNVSTVPGIKQAKTALVCCDKNGDYHLFIGVAENDENILYYRLAPTLRIKLPEKYTNAYVQFSDRLSDAIQKGEADEIWTEGYSLIRYLPARRIQEKYMTWADENFAELKKVLRSSAFDEQRAVAAQIIAYHFDKNEIVSELMNAIVDESDEVRSIAIKSLSVIAKYAAEHPEKNINIPYMPFIRLINSVTWADRNKGLSVLTQLTRSRKPDILNKLKELSLPSLKEMAVWKSEVHALPAFVILARIAGIPEEKISGYASGTNFATEAMKLASSIK